MATTKQRTVEIEGTKVKFLARAYTYMGNHCGFRIFVDGEETWKLSYLTADEAIDAALAKYWGEHMKVHDGFTKAELTKAFDRLHLEDWRGPIFKRIPRQWLKATLAAIEFFTATSARITTDLSSRDDVTIESEGYRSGPAGP